MYISYEIKRRGYNLIYKNDINKVHMLQKLHEFFKNALQNTRSMKTYVSLQFSKQEKHALYCNMPNSHEKSRLFLAPKREVFLVHYQKLSLNFSCSLYHLLLF